MNIKENKSNKDFENFANDEKLEKLLSDIKKLNKRQSSQEKKFDEYRDKSDQAQKNTFFNLTNIYLVIISIITGILLTLVGSFVGKALDIVTDNKDKSDNQSKSLLTNIPSTSYNAPQYILNINTKELDKNVSTEVENRGNNQDKNNQTRTGSINSSDQKHKNVNETSGSWKPTIQKPLEKKPEAPPEENIKQQPSSLNSAFDNQ